MTPPTHHTASALPLVLAVLLLAAVAGYWYYARVLKQQAAEWVRRNLPLRGGRPDTLTMNQLKDQVNEAMTAVSSLAFDLRLQTSGLGLTVKQKANVAVAHLQAVQAVDVETRNTARIPLNRLVAIQKLVKLNAEKPPKA